MTLPVKYFHGQMTGAPVLSGTAGSRIAVLDACLINGFNLVTVDSLVVAGAVATLTCAAGIGFEVNQVVLVAGATGGAAALNGEWCVTAVSSTWIQFACPGIGDQTATGTITVKAAPSGSWSKVFSGTNKAAYKSTDPAATGCLLRVDDTSAQYAVVRGYETMTDVDTGSGPFPTVAQQAGLRWYGSETASAASRNWLLIADERLFYFFAEWSSSVSYAGQYGNGVFGDAITVKAGDAYHCMLLGYNSGAPSYPGHLNDFAILSSGGATLYLPRSYSQIGPAIAAVRLGSAVTNYLGYSGMAYPAATDNGLWLHSPILIAEGAVTGVPRGFMPGLLQPIQSTPLTHRDVVENLSNLPGRKVMMVGLAQSSAVCRGAFDLTGPWR